MSCCQVQRKTPFGGRGRLAVLPVASAPCGTPRPKLANRGRFQADPKGKTPALARLSSHFWLESRVFIGPPKS